MPKRADYVTGHNKSKEQTLKTKITADRDNLTQYDKLLIHEAESWLGTPYKYAAAEKGEGTDCSGLVMKLYLDLFGIKLPRNSAKQAEYCKPLDTKDVTIGDLIFFTTNKKNDSISHVGIMLDHESFIHASTSKGVIISKISNPYYHNAFKMYGRIPLKTIR